MTMWLNILNFVFTALEVLPGIRKGALWVRNKLNILTKTEKQLCDLAEKTRGSIAQYKSDEIIKDEITTKQNFSKNLFCRLVEINNYYKATMSNKVHEEMTTLIVSIINIYKTGEKELAVFASKIGNVLTSLVKEIPKGKFSNPIKEMTPSEDFVSVITDKPRYPGQAYGELLNSFILRVNSERATANKNEAKIYDNFLAYVILGPWNYLEPLKYLLRNNSMYKFPIISRLLCKAIDQDYKAGLWVRDERKEALYGQGKIWEMFDFLNTYVRENKEDKDAKKYFDLVLALRCLPQKVVQCFKDAYPGRIIGPSPQIF